MNEASADPISSGAVEVTAAQAHALVEAGRAILIDVREDDEWAAGHAPAARHTPMSNFAAYTDGLPTDTPIVCVCHIGGRSAMVTQALNRGGYRAINLVGGMDAWAAAGLPIVG